MLRNLFCLILTMLIAFCMPVMAQGEEYTAESRGLTLSCGSVEYPVLMPEEDAVASLVNDRLLEDGCIPERINRLSMLLSGGELKVSWEGNFLGDVFSCVFSAEGTVLNSRKTHLWNAANIDLRTGEEVAFSALFTDVEAAREEIEGILDREIAPELSAHLRNSELTPLPGTFALTLTGLRLLYPIENLCTLSDRAGDVVIGWNEIRDVLDLGEDSILSRIGVSGMLELTEESFDRVTETLAAGSIPDLPVQLGGSLKEATDRFHMLTDPDMIENYRIFALESGVFRNVMLLTDTLSEEWDYSIIQGIRLDRGCLYGLCIGSTEKESWRMLFGEPDTTVTYDWETAEFNRTVPGECDYYTVGEHRLLLLSDEDGILRSITLLE